jgi:hypothetical protein
MVTALPALEKRRELERKGRKGGLLLILLILLGSMQVLLDLGAAVAAGEEAHAVSALAYAARRCKVEACRQLLRRQDAVVGRQELVSAVHFGMTSLVELLLESEENMHLELRQDAHKRAECLGAAVAKAVVRCVMGTGYCSPASCIVKVLGQLLDPPPHWGPVTAEILAQGVRAAEKVLHERGYSNRDFLRAIELLAAAGADLGIDDGALLKTAAADCEDWVVLETVLRLNPALAAAHGEALLDEKFDVYVAEMLIEAGALAGVRPGMYERLLWEAMRYDSDKLLCLLSS